MNKKAEKIFLLTDDRETSLTAREACAVLCEKLVINGINQDSLKQASEENGDAVIIHARDNLDALSACGQIKDKLPLRQVIIISENTDPEYIANCLHRGADDYIAIPWNTQVFQARIAAVIRRHQIISVTTSQAISGETLLATTDNNQQSTSEPSPDPYLHIGNLRICPYKREVAISGAELHLTRTEYSLLTYLAERIGKPCSSVELLNNVLGYQDENYLPSLHSHVSRLRRKLGACAATSIETIWCYGYRFLGS